MNQRQHWAIPPSATVKRRASDSIGARYYSPTLGRFMTPDWISAPEAVPYADLANPQSLNLYSYVGNNPVTATDPDGHLCCFGWLSGAWNAFTGGDGGDTPAPPPSAGNCGSPCTVSAPSSSFPLMMAPWLRPTVAAISVFSHASAPTTLNQQQISELEHGPVLGVSPFVPPEGELAEAGDAAVQATSKQIAQAEKVLAEDGPAAVERSIRSFQKLIAEHEEKIANAGGYTSSMEREIRNFKQLLQAYTQVLRR